MSTVVTMNEEKRTITIVGNVDDTPTVKQFDEQVTTLTNANKNPIIIDLSQVDYMSSQGFAVLNAARKTLGGWEKITIKGMHGQVKEKSDLIGITMLLNMTE